MPGWRSSARQSLTRYVTSNRTRSSGPTDTVSPPARSPIGRVRASLVVPVARDHDGADQLAAGRTLRTLEPERRRGLVGDRELPLPASAEALHPLLVVVDAWRERAEPDAHGEDSWRAPRWHRSTSPGAPVAAASCPRPARRIRRPPVDVVHRASGPSPAARWSCRSSRSRWWRRGESVEGSAQGLDRLVERRARPGGCQCIGRRCLVEVRGVGRCRRLGTAETRVPWRPWVVTTPVDLQLAVGPGDRPRGEPEITGQLSDRREPGADRHRAGGRHRGDLGPDLLVGRDRGVGVDLEDHAGPSDARAARGRQLTGPEADDRGDHGAEGADAERSCRASCCRRRTPSATAPRRGTSR